MDFQGHLASGRKTTQPLGGDVDIQGHGDLAHDTLLRLEPRGQGDGIAFAPDAYGSRCISQSDNEPNRAVQLIGAALDNILWRGGPGPRLRFPEWRQCSYRPVAETRQTGNEFVTKSIDDVAHVLGHAARVEGADGYQQPLWRGRFARCTLRGWGNR